MENHERKKNQVIIKDEIKKKVIIKEQMRLTLS